MLHEFLQFILRASNILKSIKMDTRSDKKPIRCHGRNKKGRQWEEEFNLRTWVAIKMLLKELSGSRRCVNWTVHAWASVIQFKIWPRTIVIWGWGTGKKKKKHVYPIWNHILLSLAKDDWTPTGSAHILFASHEQRADFSVTSWNVHWPIQFC